MNSLSWLIYAADVLGGIHGVLAAVMVACVIATIASFILAGVKLDESPMSYGEERKADKAELAKVARKRARMGFKFAGAAAVLGVAMAALPGSRTLYLVAASEAGEAVVNTPEAKEILTMLHERIKRELAK
jgi:hypothetical protein